MKSNQLCSLPPDQMLTNPTDKTPSAAAFFFSSLISQNSHKYMCLFSIIDLLWVFLHLLQSMTCNPSSVPFVGHIYRFRSEISPPSHPHMKHCARSRSHTSSARNVCCSRLSADYCPLCFLESSLGL